MPRGVADVLEVVVLAAGPDASLRGDSTPDLALLASEKYVLELHHARVGKEQRRVIGRYQRRTGDLLMPPVLKEIQEGLAEFIRGRFHVMLMKQSVKLIGIGFQIQRRPNLPVLKSPRLQEPYLPGAFLVHVRRSCTEPLAPRGSRKRDPVAFGLRQRRVDERIADAPLTKLRTYLRGSLAPARAAANELLREARFIQEPFLL